MRAVREGRCFGTTGPLLEVKLGDAGIGERFRGREGTLRVEVRTAPWVPVRRARVFQDGRLLRSEPIEPAKRSSFRWSSSATAS